jgi:hypothetical protein
MRYLLLIYQEEAAHEQWSQEELAAHFEAYSVVTDEMQKRGVMLAGDPLRLARTATTVRVRNGKTLITAGPFAETKEQLGGYYLINCKDLEEAIEIAAKLPTASDLAGCIEIRPIMELG